MVNCKVEFKLRWTKHCVLCVLGHENDNTNVDFNNIIFTIKYTKLFVPIVTLSGKGNQNFLAKDLKDLERSVYWNEYKKI